MKSALLATIAALTASIALTVVPGAHAVPSHKCVNWNEYQRVKPGMTMRRVHSIFDTNGYLENYRRVRGMVDQWRGYRQCPGLGGRPQLNFDNYTYGSRTPGGNMRLFSKDWGGGARG